MSFNINAGLITSLCRPVYVAAGFHGVMCTDVKINELLSEIEYFSEEEYSYGFIIDGTGRVLMHPLLPNVAFVKSIEDPVLVDISVLERAPKAKLVIESMKRYEVPVIIRKHYLFWSSEIFPFYFFFY